MVGGWSESILRRFCCYAWEEDIFFIQFVYKMKLLTCLRSKVNIYVNFINKTTLKNKIKPKRSIMASRAESWSERVIWHEIIEFVVGKMRLRFIAFTDYDWTHRFCWLTFLFLKKVWRPTIENIASFLIVMLWVSVTSLTLHKKVFDKERGMITVNFVGLIGIFKDLEKKV